MTLIQQGDVLTYWCTWFVLTKCFAYFFCFAQKCMDYAFKL